MSRTTKLFGVSALVVGLLALACSRSEKESEWKPVPAEKPAPEAAAPAARPVPRYHASAEAAKPFPQLVPAEYFRDYPLVARAYRIAAEIPGVIAQQPCFCYCDKFGHRSLLDCYASDHGAG